MSSLPPRLGRSKTLRPASTRLGEQAETKDMKPRRRTNSNSSGSSAVSSAKSEVEDQFFFSPHRTPAHERASFFPVVHSRGPSSLAASAAGSSQPSVENSPQLSHRLPTTKSSWRASPTLHSQPIAIELPSSVSDRPAARSVYTPIPPLSGRGDIPGGCFPFYEDPNKRNNRPHPFHTDSEGAETLVDFDGQQPQIGQKPSAPTLRPPVPNAARSDSLIHQRPVMNTATMSSMSASRGNTAVTSYVPSGHHDMPMPVGKYYPTNYEATKSRRSSIQNSPRVSRPLSSGTPSSLRTDTFAPQLNRTGSSHVRSDSDAKRRLQQYQRDMVAQATQAARQHLTGSKAAASFAAAHGVTVQTIQAGSNKPLSPRLQPLGSPGPVTPMELEGQGDGGYLTRGRSVPSPDARRDSEAVARALRAEEERRRREGRGSPTVQAGGFGF